LAQPPVVVVTPPVQPPPPSGALIPVHRGDNLASLLEQAVAGAVFVLDNDYVGDVDGLELRKPVTLTAWQRPPDEDVVVPEDYHGPKLLGGVTAFVPV